MIVNTKKRRKVLLALYLFFLMFQPPIIPMNTIYFWGAFTIVLYVLQKKRLGFKLLINAEMIEIYRIFLFLAGYIMVISVIDVLANDQLLINNRLRCINQLIVLSAIEFICIAFFLNKCEYYKLDYNEVVSVIAIVGIMQGLCSIAAYASPQIRFFFLKNNGDLFKNLYVLERRGYGFSNILLDTYGYGMGLIAGAVLLANNKVFWKKVIVFLFCSISVLLNARTGIVVIALAIIAYLFQSNTIKHFFIKGIMAIGVIFIIWGYVLPLFEQFLLSSSSQNMRWIGAGIHEMTNLIKGSSTINDVNFLSSFHHLPDSALTWLFGSGHNVYGIYQDIGFHSDVGYINYLWEFGVIGTIVLVYGIYRLYSSAYKLAAGKEKFVVLFLAVSYIVVLFKAILIGYNPGVVVNYIMLYAIIYYKKKAICQNSKEEK